MSSPVFLTDEWLETRRARAVPDAQWNPGGAGIKPGWYLPSTADDHAARVALRLFPRLIENDELVERAAVQDMRPIDLATDRWRSLYNRRRLDDDPWRRIAAQALAAERYWHPPLAPPIVPHLFQRVDCQYALDRLDTVGGAYLGWEPGLGKSLGACMVMDAWAVNFALIVCPNSAKVPTWLPTLQQFAPWMKPIVIGNSAKQRSAALEEARVRMDAGEPTAVVCHYEALTVIQGKERKSGWAPLGTFDIKVADEAHRLKNPKAGFVRAFAKIPAVGLLLLSGSILDGDFEDLHVPWKMMNPTRYPRKWQDWCDRFGDYAEGDHGTLSLGVKPHRLDELRHELGELLVVRRATDELDIPAPHVTDLVVPLLPAQQKVYDQLVAELLAELPDGGLIAADVGATLIAALRVVAGGVPLPDGGYASAKIDAMMQRFEDIGRQQRVVFTWHRELAARAAERLSKLGTVALVHGGVSNRKREEHVARFRNGRTQFLVATMSTLGESVNLQNAGGVTFLEHSWQPLKNEQARDRVLRQGQHAQVVIDNITAAQTVDRLRVLPVLLSKTLLRQLVVGR